MLLGDPTVRRFVRSMKEALARFDAEDSVAPDRHSDECGCVLCVHLESVRDLVASFDEGEKLMEPE